MVPLLQPRTVGRLAEVGVQSKLSLPIFLFSAGLMVVEGGWFSMRVYYPIGCVRLWWWWILRGFHTMVLPPVVEVVDLGGCHTRKNVKKPKKNTVF